jgi:hypothetical protein
MGCCLLFVPFGALLGGFILIVWALSHEDDRYFNECETANSR